MADATCAWFGRNLSGGRLALGPITTMYLYGFMVSPPSQVCHEYVFIFALALSQFLSSPNRAPSFLMGHPGGGEAALVPPSDRQHDNIAHKVLI